MNAWKLATFAFVMLFASASHAALVTWTLAGVKLENDEHARATGSFVYDASSSRVFDFNILTLVTGGAVGDKVLNPRPPCDFPIGRNLPCASVAVSPGPLPGTLTLDFTNNSTPGGFVRLKFVTAEALTDHGGTVPIVMGSGWESYYTEHGSGFETGGLERVGLDLVAGALVGVPIPEPSGAIYLAAGLTVLGVEVFLGLARRGVSMRGTTAEGSI